MLSLVMSCEFSAAIMDSWQTYAKNKRATHLTTSGTFEFCSNYFDY